MKYLQVALVALRVVFTFVKFPAKKGPKVDPL